MRKKKEIKTRITVAKLFALNTNAVKLLSMFKRIRNSYLPFLSDNQLIKSDQGN